MILAIWLRLDRMKRKKICVDQPCSGRTNERLYPGQIARIFKTLAKTASLNPTRISGHSTRIGAAQDLLRHGCSIGQIMAQVGWRKVDTVMHYLGATAIDVIQSQASGR